MTHNNLLKSKKIKNKSKNTFKENCCNFLEELNEIHKKNITISFDKLKNQAFCFSPTSNKIKCNFLEVKYNYSSLGEYYYKYMLLHEYGHAMYDSAVSEILTNQIQKIVTNSNYQSINKCFTSISEEKRDYISFGDIINRGSRESSADYFVIKSINDEYKRLDSKIYKIWRITDLQVTLNRATAHNQSHIKHAFYYHLPELMCSNDLSLLTLAQVIDLSIPLLHNTLKLLYLQEKNQPLFQQEDFKGKLKDLLNKTRV